ncbi:MAG: DUF2029 domain-containing protein, partial [Candidatus Eremiobacteraeota bacterium]|nr:DUF2029 domain-containing protein [Candidatus Eremiobacteraeota bacterium]
MTITTPMSGRFAAVALALVLLGGCCLAIVRPGVRPAGLMRDFNAFYCAGRAIAHRADPYRTEPLGSCERERKPAPLLTGATALVMPAPLPPYALLPFVVLARLPYVASAIVWGCAILLAVGIAALALRRATGMPLAPLLGALALTDGFASLCLGQIAPIAVAAIAVAAMFLKQRRDVAAALAASVAMIEPHVGLPACIAIFVWRGRSRVALLAVALGCVVTSLALTGLPTMLEYLRAVVPAHALSEVANEKQFSLTYALHRFGLADGLAARIGAIWYLAMLASGVALARLVAKRTGDAAALAVIPPALAVVG